MLNQDPCTKLLTHSSISTHPSKWYISWHNLIITDTGLCLENVWAELIQLGPVYPMKWGLWRQKQVSQAGISNCIPQYSGMQLLIPAWDTWEIWIPYSCFMSCVTAWKVRIMWPRHPNQSCWPFTKDLFIYVCIPKLLWNTYVARTSKPIDVGHSLRMYLCM